LNIDLYCPQIFDLIRDARDAYYDINITDFHRCTINTESSE